MKLLTKANLKALPALYTTDGQGDAAVAVVKFFNPTGSGSWYATEFDGEDTFFGLTTGLGASELGYFSLAELSAYRGKFGLGIERDRHFTPTTLGDLRKAAA